MQTSLIAPPPGISPVGVMPSELAGVNVLLEGAAGTGKTYSIGSLVNFDPALEVFYLGLESGIESLMAVWKDQGKEIPPNLHWNILNTGDSDWLGALTKKAKDIGDLTQDSLYKLQDHTRGQRNNFHKMLTLLADFEDQRTGQRFGSVGKWGPNRALVIDGLTGLGEVAMSLVIGNKPVRSQTDWGIAQDQCYGLVVNLTDACKMHFILLAHIEREKDELTGGTKIMTSALGQKLAPKLIPKFSDVILSRRVAAEWSWSTADSQTDLKTRNLPVSDKISPSFANILSTWKKRGGAFTPTVKG